MRPLESLGANVSPTEVGKLAALQARRDGFAPSFRLHALSALGPFWSGSGDHGEHVAPAVAAWAETVKRVREPIDVGEIVYLPRTTIEVGAGDCDDIAAACCALACVFGVPCMVAVYQTGRNTAHAVAILATRDAAPFEWLLVEPGRSRAWVRGSSDPAGRADLFVVRKP